MRPAVPLIALMLAASPAVAGDDFDRGTDLMQEGARLLFRGLIDQMEPAMRQMDQVARILGEIDNYQPPEILPNGDIILRRKRPLEPQPQSAPGPGEIDL